jgi:hypothetical protein
MPVELKGGRVVQSEALVREQSTLQLPEMKLRTTYKSWTSIGLESIENVS